MSFLEKCLICNKPLKPKAFGHMICPDTFDGDTHFIFDENEKSISCILDYGVFRFFINDNNKIHTGIFFDDTSGRALPKLLFQDTEEIKNIPKIIEQYEIRELFK